MSNMGPHQFTHSNSQRRASVVYGSLGKGGLFLPSDFMSSKDKVNEEDNEESAVEDTPLLEASQGRKRSSRFSREILDDEREILDLNHISYQTNDESILDKFDDAVASNQIATNKASELRWLVKSSIPLVATFLLEMSFSTVSVFAVGHLGPRELAAVSIGAMTANMTGYATIQGLATALDTLCPQAFGAKKYKLVGSYVQKCTALITVVMTPILIAWFFFGDMIVKILITDEVTSRLAADYLRHVAPGVPAYILFECGKRFLQAQGVYQVSTYVLLVAAPTNAVMTLIFVKRFGYIGAPIAVAINFWIMALGLWFCTVYVIKPENTPTKLHPLICWKRVNITDAFSAWGSLMNLAIPGLIMLEAEFLAFEVLTLLASYLGTMEVAAQSIGTNVASMTYQIPFAIGIAASTRIANFLGAGLNDAARLATQVALMSGLCVGMIEVALLLAFRTQLPKLYTDDKDVFNLIQGVMWLVAIMQVCDTMNAVSAGCLRGQGQTKVGGIVNFVSYYAIGIPLAVYLSFYSPIKGQLDGLWIGSCVALTIIAITQSYFAIRGNMKTLWKSNPEGANVPSQVV